MGEQIYDRADVRRRVLALLREHGEPMITGHVAMAMALPFWVVEWALEEAYLHHEVVFTPGVGWAMAPVPEPAASAEQGEIGS